jgi:hypothetical protein
VQHRAQDPSAGNRIAPVGSCWPKSPAAKTSLRSDNRYITLLAPNQTTSNTRNIARLGSQQEAHWAYNATHVAMRTVCPHSVQHFACLPSRLEGWTPRCLAGLQDQHDTTATFVHNRIEQAAVYVMLRRMAVQLTCHVLVLLQMAACLDRHCRGPCLCLLGPQWPPA